MATVILKSGNILVCDPCYIRDVYASFDKGKTPRYDALRCIKDLKVEGDGFYSVSIESKKKLLENEPLVYTEQAGVDSGRLWAMRAEFDCVVDVNSGFSGHIVVLTDDSFQDEDLPEIKVVSGEF